MDDEDLIAREDMVVTVSHLGYIKRVPLTTYRAQRRGGKGRSGMATRDEDFVTRLFVANTHTPVLFFSSRGIVYKEKVWRLPIGTPQSRGKALINMLPLEPGERITTIMPLPEDEDSWDNLDVMFSTTRGTVRRNKLSDFVQVNRNGKIAMKLEEEGDEILSVETCTEHDDVLADDGAWPVHPLPGRRRARLCGPQLDRRARHQHGGRRPHHLDDDRQPRRCRALGACRLPEARRQRPSRWRRARTEEIALVGEEVTEEGQLTDERYEDLKAHEQFVLTVSEKGFGKRSSSYDFRISGRGGKGIRATDTSKTDEIGELVAAFPVEDGDQIMLVSDGGQLIRVPVGGIRFASRATKGVTIFSTAKDEKVVSVERINEPEGDDESAEADAEIENDTPATEE